MKLFGREIENATIVDQKDDGEGFILYRIRFQYVERSHPAAWWHTWQYEPEIKDLGLL